MIFEIRVWGLRLISFHSCDEGYRQGEHTAPTGFERPL